MLGYTFRHQLLFTVILLVFYLHAYSCYCYSVACLSCYLVILCLQLSCYYFVHIVYMHEQSSLHTHSPGRFLTTWDLHVQILDALFLLFRCSLRPYASRRAGASPYSILVFFPFFIPAIILIHVCHTWLLFCSLFH